MLSCHREDDRDLDDDTLAVIHRRMRERGVSFKAALNDAIREGAHQRPHQSRSAPGPLISAFRRSTSIVPCR